MKIVIVGAGISGIVSAIKLGKNNEVIVLEHNDKPLKNYYSMAYPITEQITEEDMRFIDDYLHLIAETYQMAKDNPELTYLLFADYRLKEKDGN